MRQSLALSLTLTIAALLPLQATYADGILPNKTTTPQPQIVTNSPANTPSSSLTAEQAQDLIQITQSAIPLSSKLQKSFEAYRVTVQSNYPSSLYLQSAAVNNAQSGAMAAELVKASMSPVYMTLLLGGAGFILIGVPMLIIKNGHNEKARQEALPYTNQIPLMEMTQGQMISFNVLVPLGQKPDVSLNFRDRQNGLLISKRAI